MGRPRSRHPSPSAGRRRIESVEQSRALAEKYPGRFVWFVSAEVAKRESAALLTKAVQDGARGLGEIKNQVECDGPEMKRMSALAADLNVPIQIHFGDAPQASGNAVFNGGFKRFDTMLKVFPRTKFIAHADTFWANVSADSDLLRSSRLRHDLWKLDEPKCGADTRVCRVDTHVAARVETSLDPAG